MAATAVSGLIRGLCQLPLLEPAQQKELQEQLQQQFPEPRPLLTELARRRWLTLFQAKEILNGRIAGLQLGAYVIIDKLGEGGNGAVFKARHQLLKRIVALKVLRPELVADKQAVDRFYREIEVVSQLADPHIVHAYDAGPIGNTLVLAMEYVDGVNLQQLVKEQGPLPLEIACDYMRQAALGLQHAHERGLIHRDIKPANLMATKTQPAVVKILDLGLARLHAPDPASRTHNLTALESPSVMFGTPDYQAPEQSLDFHRADIRADLYSLGCTFFYLLTGRPPFEGTMQEKLLRHMQTPPPPLTQFRPEAPADLTALIDRLLAKLPVERHQTPAELVEELNGLDTTPTMALSQPEATLSDVPLPPASSKSTAKLPAVDLTSPPASVRSTGKFPAIDLLHPPTPAPSPASATTTATAAAPPVREKTDEDEVPLRRLLKMGAVLVGVMLVPLVGVVSWLMLRSGGDGSTKPEPTTVAKATPPSTEPPVVNYADGFRGVIDLRLNGAAKVVGTSLRLTSGPDQASSAFTNGRVNIKRFTTTFEFKLQKAEADGFTFTIQGKEAKSLGAKGGALGAEGIANSATVKFDLYDNNGEGFNSTGLYLRGAAPTKVGSISLSASGVDLRAGRPMRATLVYDGTTLKVTIADAQTQAFHTQNYPVDLVSVIGADTAHVGFTAATGGKSAIQDILNWTFQSN